MRESVPGDHRPCDPALPASARAAFSAFGAGLAARSQIVWAEHCSECAYPACYSSCAFYQPRPGDLHCRRFAAGIEPVAGGRDLKRIRFRKWGKLEGCGPVRLTPIALSRRREQADAAVSALIGAVPAPWMIQRSLGWRWNRRKQAQALAASPRDAVRPDDLFVVECWSPGGRAHAFTLTFLEQGQGRGMFQTRFDASGEYARLETPASRIAASLDLSSSWLVQIEPVGDAEGVEVVFGVVDFVRPGRASARESVSLQAPAQSPPVASGTSAPPLAKVVVWDLDETLWTGTLAEDGLPGVTPRPEAVAAIRALDERGVLQSIASKNDHSEAMAALKAFGLDACFLHPQVGWGPKSRSVETIARSLDLGLDAFVFIDDQPFERAEVTAAHPAVRVLAHTAVEGLEQHPWFAHPVTAESRNRRASYQAEARRTAVFEASGGDYLGFLKSSAIHLDVRDLAAVDVTRVYELSQRTNQLNFTGAKLVREVVEAMAAPAPGCARLVLHCADAFGDYGLIGFADIDLEAGRLDAFFMSCRVQRKRVEHAFFAHACARLAARGHEVLDVRFRPTERNAASVAMLTDLGFERRDDPGSGETIWRRSTRAPFPDPDVVRLVLPADPARDRAA